MQASFMDGPKTQQRIANIEIEIHFIGSTGKIDDMN